MKEVRREGTLMSEEDKQARMEWWDEAKFGMSYTGDFMQYLPENTRDR